MDAGNAPAAQHDAYASVRSALRHGHHIKKLLQPVIRDTEECEWRPIAASPSAYEYRNKMEFTFGDEYRDGPLTLGQHKKGSMYDLVSANE